MNFPEIPRSQWFDFPANTNNSQIGILKFQFGNGYPAHGYRMFSSGPVYIGVPQ